jgi:hypothetical protein
MHTLTDLEHDIRKHEQDLRELKLTRFALRWELSPEKLRTLPGVVRVNDDYVGMRFPGSITVAQLKQLLDALPDDLPVQTTGVAPQRTQVTLWPDNLVLQSVCRDR